VRHILWFVGCGEADTAWFSDDCPSQHPPVAGFNFSGRKVGAHPDSGTNGVEASTVGAYSCQLGCCSWGNRHPGLDSVVWRPTSPSGRASPCRSQSHPSGIQAVSLLSRVRWRPFQLQATLYFLTVAWVDCRTGARSGSQSCHTSIVYKTLRTTTTCDGSWGV